MNLNYAVKIIFSQGEQGDQGIPGRNGSYGRPGIQGRDASYPGQKGDRGIPGDRFALKSTLQLNKNKTL